MMMMMMMMMMMTVWDDVFCGGACSHYPSQDCKCGLEYVSLTISLKERMVMSCLKTSMSH